MVGSVFSGGVHGMDAFIVKVECDISEGFPCFELVGMLASEVKEARERTVTALKNCGVAIPSKKITVNMAPANIRKQGTGYDLPIAVSILYSMSAVRMERLSDTVILGELMLSGEVGEVRGVLPIVRLAKEKGINKFIVPKGNELEAAVIDDVTVKAVSTLKELIGYLNGYIDIEPTKSPDEWDENNYVECSYDFGNVAGQKVAKRGLEIAASGMHNVLMMGPPGTGKTLLAKCIPGILPPMSKDESLEVSSVYSVAGLLGENQRLVRKRTVIEAHHTASETALAGGGSIPKPGLISIAHRGVLFLDEMPEFSKRALEVLRQPLEDKVIHIARNGYSVSYPANFMLVGALNPCPCGMYPDLNKCTCTDYMRRRYMDKLSKPLVDRMDLCLQVLKPSTGELLNDTLEESSAEVRKRVLRAHEIQRERFLENVNLNQENGQNKQGDGQRERKSKQNTSGLHNINFNSQMGIKEIEKYCELGTKEKSLMEKAIAKYDLSARAFHRVLRTARTIADLDNSEKINTGHLSEALFFKSDVLR